TQIIEIQSACIIENQRKKKKETLGIRRVVIGGNNRILGVGCDGLTYAFDSNGIVWWISSSLGIFRYCTSLVENSIAKCCWRDRRLVECCGEFYIVDRILEDNIMKRKSRPFDPRYSDVIHDDDGNTERESSERNFFPKTAGFKVYKMDEELGKWVEAKSLGDNAFVMATDTCCSVLAHEFNGCLQNSIYFSEEEEYEIKVFKLEDGSIATMSGYSQSCFQMFVPPSFH
ncbi:hypothetical protein EUTSA_v10000476mg, partial [Eutrema salsugineum]